MGKSAFLGLFHNVAVGATVFSLNLAHTVSAQDCVWTGVAHVVAVGDVHGDFNQFVTALRAAKVIDATNRWIAGQTHLVQTGDVLDRGPDSRKAMDLLMDLEKQASAAGGRVHALIGNHETMVLMRDLRYVHPGEYASFGGEAEFLAALSPKGKYGQWILGHNAVIRINDVLFVHGGLAPSYADKSLEKINQSVRRELAEGGRPGEGVVGDPSGPLWHRGLAEDDESVAEQDLRGVLRTHGAARIVVGHTVSKDEIKVRAGGRVIMIDVGMSRFYGGAATCLEIDDGKFFSVRPDGRAELPVGSGVPPAARPRAAQPRRRRAA